MDTVSSTRLEREMKEVQDLLREKREDYQNRMAAVHDKEEELKKKRADLQERLINFYRFIQENQVKRNRALSRFEQEKTHKEQKHAIIVQLNEDLRHNEQEKHEMREKYHKYLRYQKYLDDVMNYNEDNYTDQNDIIVRGKTLEDNHRELQQRRKFLEREKEDQKTLLGTKKKRKEEENMEMQHQLDKLQTEFSDIQKEVKKMQDDIDKTVEAKGDTTKEIGQVRMACQNLFTRCKEFNERYKKAGKQKKTEEVNDVLVQLEFIGYCLEDYNKIIEANKERIAKEKLAKAAAGLENAALQPNSGTVAGTGKKGDKQE
eukprot:PhF_6_TR25792/c0_g1_i1/m.36385